MSQLKLLIKTEYLTEIKSKSFWLGTILIPIVVIGFGVFAGFMMSDEVAKAVSPTTPEPGEMTDAQAAGMLVGLFLALFLIAYGSSIYQKVRKEKVNRIMEVLATCVTGRMMMISKIISVALIGLTQIAIWFVLIMGAAIAAVIVFSPDIPWEIFRNPKIYVAGIWSLLFFVGGYVFYGSIYAACGAMTDKDNENQTYMTVLTFLLLGSFYVEQFAATHPTNAFVTVCSFIPFTAPAIGAVNAVSGMVPLWQSLLSLGVLFVFAWLAVNISGKIYTSSILLKGRKFTLSDIWLFMKMK